MNSNIEHLLNQIQIKELANGFKIISYENEDFSKYYVNYGTSYGSIDYTYQKNNKEKKHNPGIAHFLEHVLFNMPYGDAFEKFSKDLASANAYTSYNKTSYLFATTNNLMDNLQTLLDMVNTFYLTEEKVEKEKGIIVEEINMYDKNPDWNSYQYSIQNILTNSKYKDDILGLENDVKTMTLAMLQEAYEDFYTPNNQYLTIVGPKTQQAIDFIESYMTKIPNKSEQITKIKNKEKHQLTKIEKNYQQNVNQTYNSYSIKFPLNMLNEEVEIFKIKVNVILDYLFNELNSEYNQAIEENKIDYTFSYDYILEGNYILIMFYSQNKNELAQTIKTLLKSKLSYEDILPVINKKIGKIIKTFDGEKQLAEMLNNLENANLTMKKYYQILNNIDQNDIDQIFDLFNGNQTELINNISK